MLNYLKVKDSPSEVPGCWKESKLIFKMVDTKYNVRQVVFAIRKVIEELEE